MGPDDVLRGAADALDPAVDPLDPAELYHEASKLRRYDEAVLRRAAADRILALAVDQGFARARDVARAGDGPIGWPRSLRNARRWPLPRLGRRSPEKELAELTRRRVSSRAFGDTEIDLAALGECLQLTYGFSAGSVDAEGSLLRRSIPSPGALYALEVYVLAERVSGLPAGLYHYAVGSHELAALGGEERGRAFRDAMTSIGGVPGGAAYVILTAVLDRLRWKYGVRAYRLALLEAGHAGQQTCLAAAALGLASCPVQAFIDDDLAEVLGVDGINEVVMHAVALGPDPARGSATEVSGAPREVTLRGRLGCEVGRPPPPTALGWREADGEMRAAFAELVAGRRDRARARLIELEARLGFRDETVRDLLRLTEREGEALAAGEDVSLRLPRSWSEGRRAEFAASVSRAVATAKTGLGLDRAPGVYAEVRPDLQGALTLLGRRWIQRKVWLPEEADAETLVHEAVHALWSPPNVVVAEGLACLVASGADSIRQGELALPEDAAQRLRDLLARTAPDAGNRHALRGDEAWLVYPLSGSFVSFVDERFGRAALRRLASELTLAGPEPRRHEACFVRALGVSREALVEAWAEARLGGRMA